MPCTVNGRRVLTLESVTKLSASAGATRHSREKHASIVSSLSGTLILQTSTRGCAYILCFAFGSVKCPGEPACYGHGQCMSIRQLSLEADVDSPSLRFDYGVDPNNAQTYDRDSILGCKCDPGYRGYDCSQRESCLKLLLHVSSSDTLTLILSFYV